MHASCCTINMHASCRTKMQKIRMRTSTRMHMYVDVHSTILNFCSCLQAVLNCLLFPVWNMQCPYNLSRMCIKPSGRVKCRYNTQHACVHAYQIKYCTYVRTWTFRRACPAVFDTPERLRQHFNENHDVPAMVIAKFVNELGEHEEASPASDDEVKTICYCFKYLVWSHVCVSQEGL